MSQHFFCRFILIILLASTNLFSSMHDHNAKKSFTHSKNGNAEGDKQKHKDPNKDLLFSSPSSTQSFQQQSIVLQNNAANKYPLLFDRNQQACMTYYLLDGIQVAKLMQVDDEINFASNDCKPINFSFQIPYQVGSLTINTQGQCIFEKKINVYSADLTGKTIDFYDAFFSNKDLTVTAQQDMSNTGSMEILGLLKIDSNNINCKKTSNITVDSANFKVKQTISNEGTVLVKNHLAAHSRVLSNAGQIEANSADIKVDRYYYNKIFSVISAKNDLIINTPLSLNLLGFTHAQSLTINSAIGLNLLGMYAAKNMNFNALFSVNAGLSLPKFSTFSKMFSWNNVWGFGESLFIKYVPILGTIYAALKNMQGLYHQGRTICGEMSSLYKQKSIGASNLIALICLSKAMVSSTRQTYNLTQQSHSLLSNFSQTNEAYSIEAPAITIDKAKDIGQSIASSAVSHYGPSVSTDAIADCNYGIALGVNNNTNSLSNNNSGISLDAQNNIDTSSGNNTGYLGAYNLNVKATDSDILAGNYYNDGKINAAQMTVDAQAEAKNSGSLTVSELQIKSHNLLLEKTSDITAKNTYFKTDNRWDNEGQFKTEQCVIDAQKEVKNKGSMNVLQSLQVKAPKISLEKTSDITGKNAYFKVDSENPKSYFDSWQNNGKMNIENCVIDSQSDVINNGEFNAEQSLHVKAPNILFQKESKVKTKDAYYKADHNVSIDGLTQIERGSVEAGGEVTTIGKMGASNQLDINAKNITFEKESNVSASKSRLIATETIKNYSDLSISELFAHAKYVANEGHIATDKAHIKADRYFWNRLLGSIEAKDYLTIDAVILLNTIGRIKANSLNTHSFLNLNLLGLYQGSNISHDAVVLGNALGYIGADSIQTHAIADFNLLGIYQGSNISKHAFYAYNNGILVPSIPSISFNPAIQIF